MTARILELARSIPRETLDAIPRRVHTRKKTTSESIDAAIAELKATTEAERNKRGVLSEICRRHDISASSLCTRIARTGETL